jgi:hypothetical protein
MELIKSIACCNSIKKLSSSRLLTKYGNSEVYSNAYNSVSNMGAKLNLLLKEKNAD